MTPRCQPRPRPARRAIRFRDRFRQSSWPWRGCPDPAGDACSPTPVVPPGALASSAIATILGRQQSVWQCPACSCALPDTRSNHETDVIAVDGLVTWWRRRRARLVRAASEHLDPELGDDAILAEPRYKTSARVPMAQSSQSPGWPVRPLGPGAQRLDELERDADAREVLVRIRATVASGIHDGQRARGRLW